MLWPFLCTFLIATRALQVSRIPDEVDTQDFLFAEKAEKQSEEAEESIDIYNHPPSVVILGLGDSGTRAVKVTLESCGLLFCDQTNAEEDNSFTRGSHKYIAPLLNASGGQPNDPQGYAQSEYFQEAVVEESKGAKLTRHCIAHRYNKSWIEPFPWGYKNPAHFMLLPIIDAVFHSGQRFLAVARDPRDVCMGDNQGQLGSYGALVLKDGIQDALHGTKRERREVAYSHDCPLYWATVWNASFSLYRHRQLKVVRIEDLVVHSPTKSSRSYSVMECVLEHARLSPKPHKVLSALNKMHAFAGSYMGGHFDSLSERTTVEERFSTRTDKPIIHTMMSVMGYGTDHYSLLRPTDKHVCW